MGVRQWLARQVLKAADIGGWNVTQWQHGRPYVPDVNLKALSARYNSWVYACANKNAINCAKVQLRLYAAKPTRKSKALFKTKEVSKIDLAFLNKTYRRKIAMADSVEEVLDHPFIDLMNNVNDFQNGFELITLLILAQELTGNAYWYIVKNQIGLPQEIWPLMPQFMKIVPDKQMFIRHYIYAVNFAEKQIIEPDSSEGRLVQFKYPNPNDVFYGVGPMRAAVIAADLGVEMNRYETTLFANRAQPDMALILPETAAEPSETEQQRIQKDWKKKHGGKKNGGLQILTGGAELKQVSLSPKEMGFLKGRQASLNEVASVFGVPMSKLTTDNVNRANAEAGDAAYQEDTILPRLKLVEQKINEQILPMYDESLFCAFENPVPQDKEFRLRQAESRLKTGQTTINEERLIDGQEPVGWGEIPLLPMNLVPLGTAGEPEGDSSGSEPNKAEASRPKAEQTDNAIKSPRKFPPLEHPTNFVNEPLIRAYREFYKDLSKRVLANFDRDAQYLKAITKDRADDFASGWWNDKYVYSSLTDISEKYVLPVLLEGAKRSYQRITLINEFDPLNPNVRRAMELHRAGSIAQQNSTMIKGLRKELALGMSEGEGIPLIRKRVEGVFEGLSKNHAEMIARTETIWAWNEAAVQSYRQTGFVEKMQWVSSGDMRTCDFCPEMDGKIISVNATFFDKGGDFTVNGKTLNFDYEEVGHPPLHPQCRCSITPIVEDF